MADVISENMFVTLKYQLFVGADSEEVLLEETPDNQPFKFTCGLGMVLPKFEEALLNKAQGEHFDFLINPDDAYGDYIEDLCVELDKNVFKDADGKVNEEVLIAGNILPMMNDQGQRMNGKICEVTNDKVKMDFNHPLAGERLHFVGDVIEVRPATEFEIDLVKNHRCGGGCGGCGGGCHSGEGGCGGNCGGDCNCGEGGCHHDK